MRVVLTGATGLIGRALAAALSTRGDEIVALTRNPAGAVSGLADGIEVHSWADPKNSPPPPVALAGADAVVHLLGEPVAQRWTGATKSEIRDSRVLSTRQLVEALGELPPPDRPKVLISQSATGYYGARDDDPLDETAPPGEGFLAEVTRAWEHEALRARELSLRVVVTRTGVVLAAREGALAKMLPPFRAGVGGPVAGGRQYVPWIHLDDVVGALARTVEDDRLRDAVNVTAPNPVPNAELARALGRVLGRPARMNVPALAPRLLYGEMASVVITGQRVVPARLLKAGYGFSFPDLEPALENLLGDVVSGRA